MQQPAEGNTDENVSKKGCMARFSYIDDRYIRPFLVYKYDKVKKRPEFDFEDVLQEYQQIEEELNNEDDLIMSVQPTEATEMAGDASRSFSALQAQMGYNRKGSVA